MDALDAVDRLVSETSPVARLLDDHCAGVGIRRFSPGEVFDNHRHAAQVETLVVVRGRLVVWQDRSTRVELAEGQTLTCLAGSEHRLENESDEGAVLLYVKAPGGNADTEWVDWSPEAAR